MKILTRGHPILEAEAAPVVWPDPDLETELARLVETLVGFRREHGFGRAIAAPQVGISKRVIALHLGATPFAVINPEILWRSPEQVAVWDDCLSLPDIVVRVRRHRSISLRFFDEQGRERIWRELPEPSSELLQHEIDHLDGILMTDRAIDGDSIRPISEHGRLVAAGRPEPRLSLSAIAEAAERIDPVFRGSPQYRCEPLSEALGCELTMKVETANPIRSFKGRGADYFLDRIQARGDRRDLVCASAGNFGQAMAYACRKHGRELLVFVAEGANPMKVERMAALGARIRRKGEDLDGAKTAARRYGAERRAWFVEDGREPEISEGAGSMAVELLARGDAFDQVVIPLGNGAMLNGMARWFRAASPATRVVGVCSAGADAMEKSWRSGDIVERERVDTLADGIAVRLPIPEAVADMRGQVDEVLLVSDERVVEAMKLLFEHAGLLTEPSGAVGVAAILAHRSLFAGQRVATVICGGNLAPNDFGLALPSGA